jgi:hypothetical protein
VVWDISPSHKLEYCEEGRTEEPTTAGGTGEPEAPRDILAHQDDMDFGRSNEDFEIYITASLSSNFWR